MTDAPPQQHPAVTPFDIVGMCVSALGFLWAIFAALRLRPTFSAMFADFGDPAALPALTRLCLMPWFPFALAAPTPLLVATGIVTQSKRSTRVILVGIAALLTLVMPAIFLIGVYQPIFDIAGKIK